MVEEYTMENLQHRVLIGVVYQVKECFLPVLDEYTLQHRVHTDVVYQVQECFLLVLEEYRVLTVLCIRYRSPYSLW
jgi:hypothetical protein